MIKKYILSGDDFSMAGYASSDLKSVLKKLGVAADAIRRVSVAMYEAEINTIIHGGGGECEVDITSSAVTMIFTDIGPGIPDIDKAMTEGYSTANEEARTLGFGAGMGLPNMRRNATAFDIQSQVGVGTTIMMQFALK